MNRTLIVLHGGMILQADLEIFAKSADFVIAADGAANTLASYKLTPDVIVGDWDGIDPAVDNLFSDVEKIKDLSQETTDFEKAIQYVQKNNQAKQSIVLGAEGSRIDHTICALGASKLLAETCETSFVFRASIAHLLLPSGNHELNAGYAGAYVSVVPILHSKVKSSYGLKWNLNNLELELGKRDGVSNRAESNKISLELEYGFVAVFIERTGNEIPWQR